MNAAVWFHDLGFGVFPLKARSKEPACASWDDYTCTSEQAGRFVNYGVRLTDSFGVIDADTAPTKAWAAANLPHTPFTVTTGPCHDGSPGRGRHRYFRLPGDTPKFIHRDGLTIEFRNEGQYVVGPGSVHPSGVVYTADDWSWNIRDVPFFPAGFVFDDGSCGTLSASSEPFELPEVVRRGERHDQLFRLLRSCKGKGWDRDAARGVVTLANENRCDPPLEEDDAFERWFMRAWNRPDRPLERPAAPLQGLSGLRGL